MSAGELTLSVLVLLLLALPDALEAVEEQHRPGGPEEVVTGGDRRPGVEEAGRRHLTADEAPPDQVVETGLLPRELPLDLLWRPAHVGGTDGLVGVLHVLPLALTALTSVHVLLSEACGDVPRGLLRGPVADADRIGAHVGDQSDRAGAAQVDALVQLLGDGHGPSRREAQPGAGVLLQGAGGVREGR